MGDRILSEEETYAWYYKTGPEPMAGELAGAKGEPMTVILLNGYSIIRPSKFMPLYPTTFRVPQRSSFVQWSVVNAGMHS